MVIAGGCRARLSLLLGGSAGRRCDHSRHPPASATPCDDMFQRLAWMPCPPPSPTVPGLLPLSAEWATTASPRFDGAAFVGDQVWWGESLPDEGGRTAVRRRRTDGSTETLLPAPWNARSRVHEYGGGAWAGDR